MILSLELHWRPAWDAFDTGAGMLESSAPPLFRDVRQGLELAHILRKDPERLALRLVEAHADGEALRSVGLADRPFPTNL